MKIQRPNDLSSASIAHKRQGGMAIIAVLALLALVMIYLAANMHALANLQRELNMIEQKQIRRLTTISARNQPNSPSANVATNSPASAAAPQTMSQ
jgi:outer membrane lipoprotein-sorting protein